MAAPSKAEEPLPIRRAALIIGANNGGRERAVLRFAESDARQMTGVLETLGGVTSRDRLLLVNPTKAQIAGGIEQLRNVLSRKEGLAKRTELFVYYSGHSDESGLLLGEERFNYGDFRRSIESLPADVRIVVLDSCASGAMTRAKGGVKRPPFMVDDSTKVQGHAILTSSAENEAAQESDRIGGSFFTHYLVSGLRGAADASHDGRVTLNEAYQFAYNETLARTEQTHAGAQHAAYDINLSGTGDLVMTDLRGSAARLVLPSVMDGRLFVRDTKGRLAAEVRKLPGRPVELGLDAGNYNVTLISPTEVFATSVALSDGKRTELNPGEMKKVAKEWAVARGGRQVPQIEVTPPATPATPEMDGVTLTPPPTDTIDSMEALEAEMRVQAHGRLNETPSEAAASENPTTVETPKQPEIAAAPAIAEEKYTTVPWIMSIMPGLSNVEYVPGKIEGRFMLNIILGRVDRIRGVQVGVLNSIAGDLRGAQLSLGMGWTQGHVRGVQVSPGLNVANNGVEGLQAAAGFNIAGGNLRGLQGASGFNIVNGDLNGIQGAAGFNFVRGRASGWQAASGFNIAGGVSEGEEAPLLLQTASGFNFARSMRGAQIAVLNIGGDVKGAQIGLVNIGGHVKGAQVGLVNIANDVDGVPVGLISYSRTGLLHLDLWTSDTARANLGLKIGGKRFYTLLAMSYGQNRSLRCDCRTEIPGSSIGFGYYQPFSKFFASFDLSGGGSVTDNERFVAVAKARLSIGFQPFKHFGVFGGIGANAAVNQLSGQGPMNIGWGPKIVGSGRDAQVTIWPAVFAGLQI
jgi:hypothetical protein